MKSAQYTFFSNPDFNAARHLFMNRACAAVDNISFRRPTPGKELDMVLSFIEHGVPAPRSTSERVSIFLEPKILGANPDLIIVYWQNELLENWKSYKNFSILDMKLLQFLTEKNGDSIDGIEKFYGSKIISRLRFLSESQMVMEEKGKWVVNRQTPVFGIRKLIAIEAKVGNWASALKQAFANRWFASESYVLLPGLVNASHVLNSARSQGIGILCSGDDLENCTLSPQENPLPTSYMSWVVNYWVSHSLLPD